VTSHGQRFRRRALRRGYKVDEVDSFLDRVEATITGAPIDAPVTAQEVHDVVFRVRFGGYDEWQVDLHLDRVERQLGETADRGPAFGPEPAAARPPGIPPMAPPMPQRVPPPAGGAPPGPPPEPGYGRYDEPAFGGQPPYGGGEPTHAGGPADRFHSDMTTEMYVGSPRPGSGLPHRPPPPPHPPAGPPPGMGGPPPGMGGPPPGMGGPPPGMGGPPPGAPGPPVPPAAPGPIPGGGSDEVQRVDQLRRTFQPRRFGSGYDRAQVDSLFDEILAGMSGRGPAPISDSQLDPRRFDLVAGGYFEAEVDHALQEVREILRRR